MGVQGVMAVQCRGSAVSRERSVKGVQSDMGVQSAMGVQCHGSAEWADLQFQVVASLSVSHGDVIDGEDLEHALRCQVVVDQLQVLRSSPRNYK